ncbi:MAG: hypothetical protein HY096_12115, partial [Nitrospinae bacterium]|nr:hypothetical protein [Nitrospinota bacterium]
MKISNFGAPTKVGHQISNYKSCFLFLASILLLLASVSIAFAAGGGSDYSTFFTLDSRKVIWFIAQMHLFFGAFVLGVPIFAVVIEGV